MFDKLINIGMLTDSSYVNADISKEKDIIRLLDSGNVYISLFYKFMEKNLSFNCEKRIYHSIVFKLGGNFDHLKILSFK